MHTKNNQSDQCLSAALDYAKRGWPVLPLHTIRNGVCTCSKGKDCGTPGKHPRWVKDTLEHGVKDATTDPDIIRSWWEKYPDSNVGIATGARSFDALDIDIKPHLDGNDTLRDLIEQHGPLPDTLEQITGSGGRQIFFKPTSRLKNEVKFAPGLDIRTDAGLVVAPPSLHVSGNRYEWEASSRFDEVELAVMPEWLIDVATRAPQQEQTSEPCRDATEQLLQLRGKCKFIDHSCKALGNISEPLWFAMISNLATIRPGGHDLCHEYSKGHPKYSARETESKIRHSLNDAGPHTCDFIKRNGFDCGKTCGVKSPVVLLHRYAPFEPPRPLVREIPAPEPYPVEALGPILGDAAQAMADVIQSPLAICCQSVLAAAALAVQPYANLKIDGRVYPLCCYFMSVACSGERKSATDDAALSEHRQFENELQLRFDNEIKEFLRADAAYKKSREEALKKARGFSAKKEAISLLGDPPVMPTIPVLIMQEPTYEGLFKTMLISRPSVGIFSDEAGTFICGNALNDENRQKIAAGLNSIWDGNKAVTRTRGGDGASSLRNRRLSMHLMAQPEIARNFLNDARLIDQGLLSRFLVSWPLSTAGGRPYKAVDLSRETAMRRYNDRIHNSLRRPLPVSTTDERQLVPPTLALTPDANFLWIQFHNLIDRQLADNQPLSPVRGFANKAAEHAVRLSGILSLIEGATEIDKRAMANAISLTEHYLSEALRLFHSGCVAPELDQAEKLLQWVSKHEYVYLRQIYQFGPNSIREAKVAKAMVLILEDHGWLERIPDGMEIDGTYRRDVWRVIKS
jgi:hypothetical protein